jgi:hypothetical protein
VTAQLLVLGLAQNATRLVVQGSVALASGLARPQARLPGLAETFSRPRHVGLGVRLALAVDVRPVRT